jgi:hypothetical protein
MKSGKNQLDQKHALLAILLFILPLHNACGQNATIKAVALSENNIPFYFSDADEIVCMVTGNDLIGIDPDKVFPRYCHSLFPKEDNTLLL